MIINVGGRTDIVNYYSEWLLKRFEQGFVYSRNPFYPNYVYKYNLNPEVVDCVIFCSKNYKPIIENLHKISDKYNVFCHYTITAYGKDIEPNVPDINESIKILKELYKIVGKNRIAWRYDPILLTDFYTAEKHLQTFEFLAEELSPYISFCIFSFVEMYKKLEINMPEIIPFTPDDKKKILTGLGQIAKNHNLKIQTCAGDKDYTQYGIAQSGCITSEILSKANNLTFKKIAHKGNRKNCKCMPSRDIGAYDTCPNGCKYCYANRRPDIAYKNMQLHNPDSPLLIGNIKATDTIIEGRQESFLIKQCKLF